MKIIKDTFEARLILHYRVQSMLFVPKVYVKHVTVLLENVFLVDNEIT